MPISLKALAFLEILLVVGLLTFRWALALAIRRRVGPREIALTLLTPCILLVAPNPYTLYLYLIIAVLACSRNRTELAGYYLLLLPMMPVTAFEVRIGGAYIFQADIIIALGIAGLTGSMMHRPVHRHSLIMFDLAMLLMVLIFTYVGRQGGFADGLPRAFAASLLAGGAAYFVVSRGAGNAEQARSLLLMLYLAGFVTGVVAFFETIRHWSLYQEVTHHLVGFSRVRLAASGNVRGGLMRAGAAIGNSSSFGLYMAVIVSGAYAMRPAFTRVGYRLAVGCLLLALFLAQSRGAWVGAAAGYLVSYGYRGRPARAVALLVAGAALVALPSLLPPDSRLAEIMGVSGGSAETAAYRRSLLDAGLEQVRSHPLAGQPPITLMANLNELEQGQGIVDFVNSHLYVAMAAGLPLFALWLGVWLFPLVKIARRRRQILAGDSDSAIVLWPVAVLVCVMVALLFTSMADRSLIWPSLALGFAGPLLAATRRSGVNSARPRQPLVVTI